MSRKLDAAIAELLGHEVKWFESTPCEDTWFVSPWELDKKYLRYKKFFGDKITTQPFMLNKDTFWDAVPCYSTDSNATLELDREMLEAIYNQDCITSMKQYIRDGSIDLIVTSPPYKESDGFSYQLIQNVAKECYRVLKDNTLCFVNFGHLAGHKSRPFKVAMRFEESGFNWIDTIIWTKNHFTHLQGNKRLNNLTEFILCLVKAVIIS